MPSRVELCKVEEVRAGEVRRVEAGTLTLAVYNLDGEFCVTDDACTHGPGSLSEGVVEDDVIECNFATYPNICRWRRNMKALKSWDRVNEVFDKALVEPNRGKEFVRL